MHGGRSGSARIVAAFTTVLLLTACDTSAAGPASDQGPVDAPTVRSEASSERPAPRVPGPRGPAEILALGEELGLTGEQRSAIRSLRDELQEVNEPLWTEVRGTRFGEEGPPPDGPGPRGASNDPTMQLIRENARAAMEDAVAILSAEQLGSFHELRRTRIGTEGAVGLQHDRSASQRVRSP